VTPELIGLLFTALAVYSYLFIRKAGEVQQTMLIPFLYRIHLPNVLETITDEEHELIHDHVDYFNLRIIACFAATIFAVGSTSLFLFLLVNGGDAKIAGYIASILFAFVCANYNLNTTVVSWVRASESELLARVLQNKADAGGFDTLGEYLQAENDKMIKDAIDDMNRIADEFLEVAEEIGFDPGKDYEENEDTIEEFFSIMDEAQKIMRERYPEQAETFDK
jgi:hypothetical protein